MRTSEHSTRRDIPCYMTHSQRVLFTFRLFDFLWIETYTNLFYYAGRERGARVLTCTGIKEQFVGAVVLFVSFFLRKKISCTETSCSGCSGAAR